MPYREDLPATTRIDATAADGVETRSYFQITPAEVSPAPIEVHRGFERLYATLQPEKTGGILGRLGVRTAPTTVEWLVISDGGTAAPIRYLVGVTGDRVPLDALKTPLRTIFPTSYEFEQVACHPGALLTWPSEHSTSDPGATTGPSNGPYVAGVEFTGECEHTLDWQTRLTTYGSADPDMPTASGQPSYRRGSPASSSTNTVDAAGDVPLSGLVETMANAEFPMLYQVLLRPKPDWTAALEARRQTIKQGRDTIASRVLADFFGPSHNGGRRGGQTATGGRHSPTTPPGPPPSANGSQQSRNRYANSRNRYANKRNRYDTTPPSPAGAGGAGGELPASADERLQELHAKDARHCFDVTARAAVVAPPTRWDDPQAVHAVARELQTALEPIGHTTYDVAGRIRRDETIHTGTYPPGQRVLKAIAERECMPAPPVERWAALLPGADVHALVADLAEAPACCLLDGAAMPATARRAVAPRQSERTAIVPPSPSRLARYRGDGMYLGHVIDQDGAPESERLVLPPALQTTHSLVLGKSGSGKSVLVESMTRTNHAATDGASIVLDKKGDGLPEEYLKTHYRAYGTLDDIVYLDCSELLPALSILDIRPDLEAGRTRTAAVEDRADFLEEILAMLMDDGYEDANRSPQIIQYLVKAAFDEVHGADAVTYADLQTMLTQLHDHREVPATTDEAVASGLAHVAANAQRSFDAVMEGIAARLEEIQQDSRLRRLFEYAPDDRDDESVPLFSFDELLNEDVVIVIDLSDMREATQRAFVLVLFAQLWGALKRREQRRQMDNPDRSDVDDADCPNVDGDDLTVIDGGDHRGVDGDEDASVHRGEETDPVEPRSDGDECSSATEPPLVNLYVEEAAEIAASDLVTEFLRRARGFNCAVTLAMQFPEQIRSEHPEAYRELLNDISTIIAGNIGEDRRLATRFATDDMPPEAVANRLRRLEKGQWLVSLPAPFGDPEPRPFLMQSPQLPPGHPEGEDPLSPARRTAFKGALDVCTYRTAKAYGLSMRWEAAATTADTETGANRADTASAATAPDDDDATIPFRYRRSALPHTKRLPDVVDYDDERHALVCKGCDRHWETSSEHMKRAITCCNSLDVIDRDDVPICSIPLTLSTEDIQASAYSLAQLQFLQAVFTAHQGDYDMELEYDLRRDSMIRLREYVGIERDAVDELVDNHLLNKHGNNPHRLYTVTDAGLELIDERRREGITHGDGIGDLGESSPHRVMVFDLAAFLRQEFVDDASCPAVEVRCYHEADGYRYDAVALDADGTIVAAGEAERSNNDLREAVPEDYDKLAAADPEEAIWIVENRNGAHKVLNALNQPNDNVQRVAKTYSQRTPPQKFTLDEPGVTDIYTHGRLRNLLSDL